MHLATIGAMTCRTFSIRSKRLNLYLSIALSGLNKHTSLLHLYIKNIVWTGNPYWRGRLSTVDLLVLTSLDQLLLIQQKILCFFTKQATLMYWAFPFSWCSLVWVTLSSLVQCLSIRPEPTQMKLLSGAPLWGRLLAFLNQKNISLNRKGLSGTNTPANYEKL